MFLHASLLSTAISVNFPISITIKPDPTVILHDAASLSLKHTTSTFKMKSWRPVDAIVWLEQSCHVPQLRTQLAQCQKQPVVTLQLTCSSQLTCIACANSQCDQTPMLSPVHHSCEWSNFSLIFRHTQLHTQICLLTTVALDLKRTEKMKGLNCLNPKNLVRMSAMFWWILAWQNFIAWCATTKRTWW